MGKLVSGSMMIEGCFGCMMYLSLDKMHLMALHGSSEVALEALRKPRDDHSPDRGERELPA